ncbi:hypothetical protein ACIP17_05360 [Streptomyces iakyrus]|uniref:hypothetical protein n=1 Tax=Streptomyces iakyrus TaxID=68219 RepID=UPI0037FADD68
MPTVEEYRIDANTKRLAAQDTTLGNIRSRAVWLLTVAALLLSFTKAAGSTEPLPEWAPEWLLGLLAAMTLIVVGMTVPFHAVFGLTSEDFRQHGKEETSIGEAISHTKAEIKSNDKRIVWYSYGLLASILLLAGQVGIILYANFDL